MGEVSTSSAPHHSFYEMAEKSPSPTPNHGLNKVVEASTSLTQDHSFYEKAEPSTFSTPDHSFYERAETSTSSALYHSFYERTEKSSSPTPDHSFNKLAEGYTSSTSDHGFYETAESSPSSTPNHSLYKMAEASYSSTLDNSLNKMAEASMSTTADNSLNKIAETLSGSSTDHVKEANEDPVKMEKPTEVERYKKKKGCADMSGELFEVRLAALLFVRCLIKGYTFKIAANMAEAGSFDDIVLSLFDDITILIQLKHRLNKTKIVNDNHFAQLNGDFALFNYCETFCSFKLQRGKDLARCGKFEKSIFVLYTNARVGCLNQHNNQQKKTLGSAKEDDIGFKSDDKWQNLLNTGGNYCSIEKNSELYKAFKNVLDCKRILKEKNNFDELLKAVNALNNKDVKEIPPKEELDALEKRVDCFEEFLSRVWIFGGQASEEDMISLLDNDIKTLFHVSDPAKIRLSLLERVQQWWRTENFFIKKNTTLLQDILKPRWEFLSLAMMNRLDRLDIEFEKSELYLLKNELLKNKSLIQFVITNSPIVTCLKIVRCLNGIQYVIADHETFKEHQNEIMSYSMCNVVLILFDENVKFQSFKSSIGDMQLKKGNWRVILISRKQYNNDPILDTFNLFQLCESSRKNILSKYVRFQGKKVQLKDITFQNSTILSMISGETIVELLNDNKRLSIGNTPAEVIGYFVNRDLQRKDTIRKDILKEDAKFAISGSGTLRQLIPKGEKVLTYKAGDKIEASCKIFEIRDATDFEELCRAFERIHWLQENGEGFQWVKSKGLIEIINRYLGQEKTTSTWEKLAFSSERLIVLIAEPGMGKSILMSQIAKKMKELNRTSWVIKINLIDYGTYLSGTSSNLLELLEMASNISGDFQKRLLQLSLDAVGNIAVFLDGFDEISPCYTDRVIKIIQKLLHDTKVKQIWVSSRPVMKEKLVEQFCILPYVLMPFSEEDRKAFLCKFWHVSDSELCTTKFLKVTGLWLNDKLGEFTGVPLQLKMLAEIYNEEVLSQDVGVNELKMTLDISELYEKFIDKILHIYSTEKLKQNAINPVFMAEWEDKKKELYNKHMIYSIFSIFPEDEFSNLPSSKDLKSYIKTFIDNFREGKEKMGIIVNVHDDKPTFIHRTFAEYFTAKWLEKNYRELPKLVEYLLFSPNLETMWIFFDRSVTRGYSLHVAVLDEDKHLVKQLVISDRDPLKSVDKCGRTALHLAVINYGKRSNDEDARRSQMEILETILSFHKWSMRVSDKLLGWTPLTYADKMDAWKIVDLFLQQGADDNDMEYTYARLNNSLFLAAVLPQIIQKGCNKILEFLIRYKPEIVDMCVIKMPAITEDACPIWSLLHYASSEGQREIVGLLIKKGANLEARDTIYGETALLWAAKFSKWDIVELLIDNGADITATSRERERDGAVVRLSQDYSELTYFLLQDQDFVKKHNVNNDICDTSVISDICERINDQKRTHNPPLLEKGNTLLHYAAKFADNDTLCRLLEYPAVLNLINNENRNSLLPIEYATRASNWNLVQTLLNHGAICTPIVVYHTVTLGKVDIMDFLLKIPEVFEFRVYSKPIKKFLLVLALKYKQWDMFKFLIKHGL